jgi:hypothetical protein
MSETLDRPEVADEVVETWRQVCGYEGIYEVSNQGRVKSLFRLNQEGKKLVRRSERILTKAKHSAGYIESTLCVRGVCLKYLNHRLVAEAFIPNPDSKPEVNHKNLIKTDNRISNLEWVTKRENHAHAARAGLYAAVSNPNVANKMNAKKVEFLREDGCLGYPQHVLAWAYGISQSTVSAILSKKSWAPRSVNSLEAA